MPIIGSLFYPCYLIVNASSTGHMGDNQLAGFGLGSLTLGIMAISIGTCFSLTVGSLVAPAFGAKDYKLCRLYLHRQYYLNTWIFLIISIPLIFIRQIYSLIG